MATAAAEVHGAAAPGPVPGQYALGLATLLVLLAGIGAVVYALLRT